MHRPDSATEPFPVDAPDCTTLSTSEGMVEFLALKNGRARVTLKPFNKEVFTPRLTCETSLPLDVVELFLMDSFHWLCDSLARHDDPEYVIAVVKRQLFAYVQPELFRGKRLLDFGCGSGASTLGIGALLPETEVVGVELSTRNIDVAKKVLAVRQLPNVSFLSSPAPDKIGSNIGRFDFVVLSAVFEHLLPGERRLLLPQIWHIMNPESVLFVNQTPYRYFPYEHHSSGLWFVNYLPDRLAHFVTRRFSTRNTRINRSPDWHDHLRGGIRGGSEREILRLLKGSVGKPTILQPLGRDRASYWLSCTNAENHRRLKKLIASAFRWTDRLLGMIPSTNLDVAIRKEA